jgi:hypothetical protein
MTRLDADAVVAAYGFTRCRRIGGGGGGHTAP